MNSPDAFVYVAANGKIQIRKTMRDLFKNAATFPRTAGGIFWCGGGWIDEARLQAIVVNNKQRPREFRIVDLQTGKVRRGAPDVVTTALKERNTAAAELALELTAELKLAEAREHLPWFLSDEQPALELRVRAAVALAVLGDRQGADVISQAALEAGPWQDYALLKLPVVLGDEAAPILCDAVRRHGRTAFRAIFAMRRVGTEAAIQSLLPMLNDTSCPDGQDFAIECLGDRGPAAVAAVPQLMKFLAETPKTKEPRWTQELAVMALGRIGPGAADAIPLLQELQEQNGARILRLRADRRERPLKTFFDNEMFDAESLGKEIVKALSKIEAG